MQPNDRYRGSMMHLASVDPFYVAALEIAYADTPAGAELCVRCHVPTGWLAGRGTPSDGSAFRSSDKHGISCDLCHRMVVPPPLPTIDAGMPDAGVPDAGHVTSPVNDGGALPADAGGSDGGNADGGGGTHPDGGAAQIDFSGLLLENTQVFLEPTSQLKYGPFGSPYAQTHDAAASALFQDSRLCAHCHEVTLSSTTRKLPTGEDTGTPMPIERTYTEWRQSDFAGPGGKSCQACHMPTSTNVAASQGGVPERQIGDHLMVGGNTLAPRMVAHLYRGTDDPDFANLDAAVERTVAAARQLLQNESAKLDVISADPSSVVARITNLTGHKLPTGYAEGRRMWLSHEVRYRDGSPPLRSGTPDPTTWDFVEGEAPEQIWEIKLGESSLGTPSFHFAKVDTVFRDTRIPPEGFRPSDDTRPVGYVYPTLDTGAVAHFDDVRLPLGTPPCWPVSVEISVYYQSASGEYFRFLTENAPVAGPALQAAWDAVGGGVPERMQHVRVWVHEDGSISPAEAPVAPTGCPTADAGLPDVDAGSALEPERPDAGGVPPTDTSAPRCRCTSSSSPAPLGWLALGAGICPWIWRRRQRHAPNR